jgi:hypothetical protein
MAKPISYCTVEGCARRAHGQGLCNTHYRQRERTGAIQGVLRPRTTPPPKVCVECDQLATAHGRCQTHYKRWKKASNTASGVLCAYPECERPVFCRQLCETHYNNLRVFGQPQRPIPTREERFWKKVDRRGADDCWPWKPSRHSGEHGTFWNGERHEPAHRYAYRLAHGSLDPTAHIHHTCETPACVNPAHLTPLAPDAHIIETWVLMLRRLGYTVIPPES